MYTFFLVSFVLLLDYFILFELNWETYLQNINNIYMSELYENQNYASLDRHLTYTVIIVRKDKS